MSTLSTPSRPFDTACVLLLLSGLASAPLRAQVNWTLLSPATVPPSRNSTAMVYDSARDRMVLHAGVRIAPGGVTVILMDTWEWDGADWTMRTPPLSPPARNGHAMAYDSARGRTVLFGGATTGSFSYADTWEWDGTTWLQLAPTTVPPARVNHQLAYDSARGVVVLFGGHTTASFGTNLADTWEWNGSNWTLRATATSPPATTYHAMAYAAARGAVVLFGGRTNASSATNQTWEYDGLDWVERFPANAPSPRIDHELAYDSARDRVVLFGGFFRLAGTWEWDGSDWLQRSTAQEPSGRYAYGIAYDAARRSVLLFGGFVSTQVSDTWRLAPTAPADFVAFGAGCAGTAGIPTLAAAPGSLPWLGGTLTMRLSSLPAQAAVVLGALGFSNTSSAGSPLPRSLDGFGMNGCTQYVSVDASLALPAAGGAANWQLAVPANAALLGLRLYAQGLVPDGGANAFGATVSNAAELVIGGR